jgi:alkylation response protein AidB-like acyl-CoA dehydrogenase
MNFTLSDEQVEIQKAAQKFAGGEFDHDMAMALDERREFPLDILKKAADLGFIGIPFPEDLGGLGGGAVENAIVVEAFSRKDSGIGASLGLADFGSEIILHHGNTKQKEKYLPSIAKGESIVTLVFSAATGRRQSEGVSISVKRIGDGYVVNGKEDLIINAGLADFSVFVSLLADDSASAPKLIAFIVENNREGLHFSKRDTMGLRMTSSGQMTLNDLKVPEENIIADEDQGFLSPDKFLGMSNIKMAALALGMAQGALDRALNYAKEREAFGRPIGQFQAIQHYLANMTAEIELARLMTYRAAWLHSKGLPCYVESNVAKLAASEAALYATSRGMQILAGYGFMMEYDMQRYWRDAKVFEFAPIPNEMAHGFLGDSLGLPNSNIPPFHYSMS